MSDAPRIWPWHDAPGCPECAPDHGPGVTPELEARRTDRTLICVICSHRWEGAQAECAQARRAEAWWDRIADGELTEDQAKQEVLDSERRARLAAEAEAAQCKLPWANGQP